MKICPNCKTENPSKAMYCMNCSALLVEEEHLPEEEKLRKELEKANQKVVSLEGELEKARFENEKLKSALDAIKVSTADDIDEDVKKGSFCDVEDESVEQEDSYKDADYEVKVSSVDYDNVDDSRFQIYEQNNIGGFSQKTVRRRLIPGAIASMVLGVISLCIILYVLFIPSYDRYMSLIIIDLLLAFSGLWLSRRCHIYYESPNDYMAVGMLKTGELMTITGICVGVIIIVFIISFKCL